jgi:hypothetical protein
VIIVIWPGGRGTHAELGAALVCAELEDKEVLFVSDLPEHHKACPETCAFYHHPKVQLFWYLDELMGYMSVVYP